MRAWAVIVLVVLGLTGLTQLVVGALFWSGLASALIPLHVGLGFAFVVLLWALAALALGAGASSGLAGLTFLWGIVVALIGTLHVQSLSATPLWMRILHLLVGLMALGLARLLMVGIPSASARSAQAAARPIGRNAVRR